MSPPTTTPERRAAAVERDEAGRPRPLPAELLYRESDPAALGFRTTAGRPRTSVT